MEETETGCLHCEINEIVQRHIERDDPVNLPDLVARVGESLVDLILLGVGQYAGGSDEANRRRVS